MKAIRIRYRRDMILGGVPVDMFECSWWETTENWMRIYKTVDTEKRLYAVIPRDVILCVEEVEERSESNN